MPSTERTMSSCFVVSPIGPADSLERKHANIVLKFIVRPVLLELGFEEPVRADTLAEPGLITRQIISHLLNDDLVIADLTGRNPNVFYELAIRHAAGRPFVQLITRGEIIPFDVGHQRTIEFDRTDLDDVEACKAELKRQVQATMAPAFKVETPIGHALDFESLRSGSSTEQTLSVIVDRLDRIDARVRGRDKAHLSTTMHRIAAMHPQIKTIRDTVMGWGYKEKLTGDYCEGKVLDLWHELEELRASRLMSLSDAALERIVQTALDSGKSLTQALDAEE